MSQNDIDNELKLNNFKEVLEVVITPDLPLDAQEGQLDDLSGRKGWISKKDAEAIAAGTRKEASAQISEKLWIDFTYNHYPDALLPDFCVPTTVQIPVSWIYRMDV